MIVISRFGYTPMGTFGLLTCPEFSCFTLEPPWINNTPYLSCIPVGEYLTQRTLYTRGDYTTLELMNVPGRSHILLHAGNTIEDTEGCIMPGRRLGFCDSLWAITDSRKCLAVILTAYGLAEKDPVATSVYPAVIVCNMPAGGIL